MDRISELPDLDKLEVEALTTIFLDEKTKIIQTRNSNIYNEPVSYELGIRDDNTSNSSPNSQSLG